jgi:hypothetical protein
MNERKSKSNRDIELDQMHVKLIIPECSDLLFKWDRAYKAFEQHYSSNRQHNYKNYNIFFIFVEKKKVKLYEQNVTTRKSHITAESPIKVYQ